MTVSKARALPVAALSAIGALSFVPSPASAQPAPAPVPALAPAHSFPLSSEERRALLALEIAARGSDRAAQDAALAQASAVARSDGARHALAHFQLEIGRARQDVAMTSQAVDALAGSSLATREELPSLLVNQALRAYYENQHGRAERLLSRAVELDPTNGALTADYAQLKSMIGGALIQGGRQQEAQTQFRESVTMFERAIQLQTAAGQAVPESWYKRGAAVAFDHNLAPQSVVFARLLVSTYPSPVNWRDALFLYSRAVPADPALSLDIMRLQRAARALSGERDYVGFAQALEQAQQPPTSAKLAGEMKAVLDEGVERGMLSASEPIVRQLNTANNRRATTQRAALAAARTQALAGTSGTAAREAGDAHFGFGMYGEAAELYAAALQKGGEDANLVNTRLGAALALAGRRPEAEVAFGAVTGPRADLAGFWLAWLARRPA